MEKKILTQNQIIELGLDKVSVITADMLDGYTSIGNDAFWGCKSLTSIEIPNSVTSIGREVFYRCTGLTSVTIPNSVTSIGKGAFYGCTGLTSIEIPNSVTSIGDYAFLGCSSLTSIEIPNSVTSIGSSAFADCTGLTSVTIGNKKYKTQEVANGKCKAYKAFNADMICREFQYDEGKTYDFNGVPKLCKQGFHACLNLADVFRYYNGEIRKDIVVHEVELEGVSDEMGYDSKVVAKKITIGKRIL